MPDGRVTNQQILLTLTELQAEVKGEIRYIRERQDETLELAKKTNGSVQEHGRQLAAIAQWRTGHDQVHEVLQKEVDNVKTRTTIVGFIDGAVALIASTIAAMIGRSS